MGALLFLFVLIAMPVSAADNGDLKLNTGIITNNEIQNGGAGGFPIRGSLFSEELNAQEKKNEELSSRLTDMAGKLDFKEQPDKKADTQQMTSMLFQDYHPQVIFSKNSRTGHSRALYYAMGALGAAVLLVTGILTGRWWAKRGRMVHDDRDHAALAS